MIQLALRKRTESNMFSFFQRSAFFWWGEQSAKLAEVDLVDLALWIQRLGYLGCHRYPLPLPQIPFFLGAAAAAIDCPQRSECFGSLGQEELYIPVVLFYLKAIQQGNWFPPGVQI